MCMKVRSGYKNVWDKERFFFSLRRKVKEKKKRKKEIEITIEIGLDGGKGGEREEGKVGKEKEMGGETERCDKEGWTHKVTEILVFNTVYLP